MCCLIGRLARSAASLRRHVLSFILRSHTLKIGKVWARDEVVLLGGASRVR